MLVTELRSEVVAPALARTYRHPSYGDPWTCVEDYFRVLEYQAEHPQAGRTKVGNALELPPGRVRGWLNDTIPDCVRAIQVAEAKNWLDCDYTDRVFRGLNVMVAWLFSGGSLSGRYYHPYFVVPSDSPLEDSLRKAAELVGVPLRESREGGSGRARELSPSEYGTVLGRVCHLLGVPTGDKNPGTDLRLPGYLDAAPDTVRTEFATVYARNRGGWRGENKDIWGFREERSAVYLDQLATFMSDVFNGSVRSSERNLYFSQAATERLQNASVLADVEADSESVSDSLDDIADSLSPEAGVDE